MSNKDMGAVPVPSNVPIDEFSYQRGQEVARAADTALLEACREALELWRKAVAIRFEVEREDWLESETMIAYMRRNQEADDVARAVLEPVLAQLDKWLNKKSEKGV